MSASDVSRAKETYLYLFTRRRALLYAGVAYRTQLAAEVRQNIRSFQLDESNIVVWPGYITYMDYGRVTKRIILSIESLLICLYKPTLNSQKQGDYVGGHDLYLKSYGCPHLASRGHGRR